VTKDGLVLVADCGNHCIRTISPEGKVTKLAGNHRCFSDGDISSASFNDPRDVAIGHDGIIFVADSSNHRIRLITPEGQVSTLAGSGEPGFSDGEGNVAKFYHPFSIAIDLDGHVIVADLINHRIRQVSLQGKVSTIAGNGEGFFNGIGYAAMFCSPTGVSVDGDGIIIVADQTNCRIRMITQKGQHVTTIAGCEHRDCQDGMGTAKF
jgi:glucose/arabinose dehydrogenase